MLSPLYPAAPIGVLSIFNQLLDWMVINELADCLVESAQSILPPDDDFTRLALAMRRLLVITDLKTFSHTMAKVCDDLEQGILVVLGKQSLVRVYLVFLLNAQKAKSKHQKDNKVLSMALERFAHVQHAYKDNAKLILEFNLFVVGYLSIVTPGAPDVASMASACYTRATEYLTDRENFGSEVEIRNAKFHLGKSCAYLADCRYAVGQENKDEEQCSSARGMLLVAIGHHADCAEATFAHVGRQMEKLAKWCKEANDTERLDHLNLIYGMIEGKEQRPKGEPLLPRLRS
ncbi:hypothetical protein CkaCkLH20_10593 [Colletotrichum karsti]|uniref:Uncharacterized protein n=1 Tax=Colletotrichum karsti TaxID=1095194 RepID=A0A9P6HZD8_9PEZI|nr:uncharacterized protein CkaCkLH20_10593 [Colletotrichum karsti]KAF9871961.1 hypothetical protein CkaCkLH20_10593 [Colletotrichum karsti]